MNLADKVSILYVSCKKFSDLWVPYFDLFRRHWVDCPFRIYALTECGGQHIHGVELLRTGVDVSWSDNLRIALDRIDTPYVLLLLDDFFITSPVQNDQVVARLAWAADNEQNYLRLCGYPPKPVGMLAEGIGVLPKGAHYRNSTRFPLWRRAVLQQVLVAGESAWEFEVNGSVRSDEFDGFCATYDDPFDYANCVIKGKWNPTALARVHRLGVSLDLSVRPHMSAIDSSRYVAALARSVVLSLVPYSARRSVRDSIHNLLHRPSSRARS